MNGKKDVQILGLCKKCKKHWGYKLLEDSRGVLRTHSNTYKWTLFARTVYGFQPLSFFLQNRSITDVQQGPKYGSGKIYVIRYSSTILLVLKHVLKY